MKQSTYKKTDRECFVCEDGQFYRDGAELFCDSCHYSPTFDSRTAPVTDVEYYRISVQKYAYDEAYDERPKLVGGFESAYYGEGEYCLENDNGFSI